MPLHDFECAKGHQFEKVVEWDQESVRCPKCRGQADRIWMSRNSQQRQFTDPIVVHKLPDGSFSFPGRSDVPTPKGAERIEMRTMQEYTREFKEINSHFASQAARHDEALHERHEAWLSHHRAELRGMMGQTNDPILKDLCRHALESYNTDVPQSSYAPIWNEAMECDASNREAWHSPGETGLRGRK